VEVWMLQSGGMQMWCRGAILK